MANKFIVKKEKKNYLSKSSGAVSTVIRTMLNEPQRQWQVIILADESGKAIGTVSNVKSFLRDRDWIKESSNEFELQNIKELLYAWAKDYHKKFVKDLDLQSISSGGNVVITIPHDETPCMFAKR